MERNNESWAGFKGELWKKEINVRDFIQNNYTPYTGDDSFLKPSSEKTRKVWNKLTEMFKVEREKGVYDTETKLPQSITTYGPGYIDKDNEVVVGLQTDYCIDATIKCGFEHGFKMIVPENANSTFDNAFMTGEQSYKYYNEFMWKGRYAECVSVEETIKRMKG